MNDKEEKNHPRMRLFLVQLLFEQQDQDTRSILLSGFVRSWKTWKSHGIPFFVFQAWKSHGILKY